MYSFVPCCMIPAVRRWRWGCQLPRRAFGDAVGDQSCGASTPILWNRWKVTNPHALIIAESGSGKTYGTFYGSSASGSSRSAAATRQPPQAAG
jgi:hypothetical protein